MGVLPLLLLPLLPLRRLSTRPFMSNLEKVREAVGIWVQRVTLGWGQLDSLQYRCQGP